MTSTQEKIAKAQENLPLPEQPPKASDWQSADASKTGTGNGSISGHIGTDGHSDVGLRAPAPADSSMDMSKIGREGKDNLDGPPKDAAAR